MLPWAATSKSLWSHLAARCFQALGTGAVESLVPLILQDMSFIYERNKFIASLWASGGVMACGLGIASSHIVADLSWRWFYWIMTIPGALAFILTFIFVPETKYPRSMEALGSYSSYMSSLRPNPNQRETQAYYHHRNFVQTLTTTCMVVHVGGGQ
jgi:MFS family permease